MGTIQRLVGYVIIFIAELYGVDVEFHEILKPVNVLTYSFQQTE